MDVGSLGRVDPAERVSHHTNGADLPHRGGDPASIHFGHTIHCYVALVMEQEEEGHTLKVQCLVYFVSEVLSDSKTRYLKV